LSTRSGWSIYPRHFDHEMFCDRLVALRANVGDSAEHVQLGHIASRGAGRNFVAHGAVAVHGSFRPVSREARDVHEVKLREAAVAHVALVHEHDSAQALEPSVSVVVRVDRRYGNGLHVEPGMARLIPNRRCLEGGSDILGQDVGPQPSVFHIHNSVVSLHSFTEMPQFPHLKSRFVPSS